MKTIEYTTIDRAALKWPSGPWDGEPDKKQWQDPKTGMACLAVRHPHSGHWCGYVGVEPSYKMYQEEYNNYYDIDVHGGLTFSECSTSTILSGPRQL